MNMMTLWFTVAEDKTGYRLPRHPNLFLMTPTPPDLSANIINFQFNKIADLTTRAQTDPAFLLISGPDPPELSVM